MPKNKVIVYGEIGIDNLISVPHPLDCERDAFVTSDEYLIGGYACNISVLLALWDISVRIAGYKLGEDDNGRRILDLLSKYPRIDLSRVEIQAGANTSLCRVVVPPNGDRYIMVFNLPERCDDPTPLTADLIGDATHIVFDSLALRPAFQRAPKVAKKAGLFAIGSDVNQLDRPIIPFLDVICNSSALLRKRDNVDDPRAYALQLHKKNNAVIITTNGADPIHVVQKDGSEFWVHPPAVPHENVIDTTGAGDSLKAGIAYGIVNGWPLEKSVSYGAAAGALIIQAVGAVTREPSMAEITTLMDQVLVSKKPHE